MKEANSLHSRAMECIDEALEKRRNGLLDEVQGHFLEAYHLERQAALIVAEDLTFEPSRSVLLRSAAALALDCELPLEAEKLACLALSGNPPGEIAEELRDILAQVLLPRELVRDQTPELVTA